MNKKKLLLPVLCCLFLTGCDESASNTTGIKDETFELISDNKTGIIYIDNEFTCEANWGWQTVHIYTPYYSENGKLCRYDDGRMVEVDD